MRNMIAVYSPRSGITTGRFAKLGAECGYAIRFLTLSLNVPLGDFRGDRAMLARLSEAHYVCGWPGAGTPETNTFDAACLSADRDTIKRAMRVDDVRWFELYTHQFDYGTSCRKTATYQAKIDAAAPPDLLPVIQSAKSRYIFHNRNHRGISEGFMRSLATALAAALEGAVVNHIHPGTRRAGAGGLAYAEPGDERRADRSGPGPQV